VWIRYVSTTSLPLIADWYQETHYDTDSSNSDDDTPVGSDEDEADALEHRSPSISSATTGYESNYSSTDSAESSSVNIPLRH
jgi:hypothetical protein